MDKKLALSVLILFLLVAQAWAGVEQHVTAVQARQMLQEENRPFLLDVRTPGEYIEVRLEGATLIPIDQVVQRISEIPKDRPLLIYCAIGSRSSLVSEYLARNGYGPVYNLDGGISAWQHSGFPVLNGPP